MLITLTIFALATVGVRTASVPKVYMDEWKTFKIQYGKIYENEKEEEFRLQVYLNTLRVVQEHNKLHAEGKVSFQLKINRYSDLLREEFEKMMGMNEDNDLGYDPTICELHHFKKPKKIAKKVDWRTEGAVTPVKDQGTYGACWAFSAVGALESHHFRKTKKLVRLSEQNLIDCIKREGAGGQTNAAFQYVVKQKGIDSEESYTYVGETQKKCLYKKKNAVERITGCGRVKQDDEEQLKYAVQEIGPISVALYMTDEMRIYTSGVLMSQNCSSATSTNHAVLIVGYGTEGGEDYWLAKNSWGDEWGDHGYFKIARNKNSHCMIAYKPNYPIG